MTTQPVNASPLSPQLQAAIAELEPTFSSFVETPLYHYTSVGGLKGILKDYKTEMWFTNARHLNDPTELDFGRKIARKVLEGYRNREGRGMFTSALFELMHKGIDPLLQSLGVYVASFSRKADDLGQWRAYADDGWGVCIKFSPVTSNSPQRACTSGAVAYGKSAITKRQSDIFDQMWEIFDRPHIIEEMVHHAHNGDVEYLRPFQEKAVISSCLFSKHQAYQAEDEVRFVIVDDAKKLRARVETRVRDREIVPYIKQELPFLEITQVQLGPAASPATQDGIRHLLRQHEYADDILVSQSKIPYRSC